MVASISLCEGAFENFKVLNLALYFHPHGVQYARHPSLSILQILSQRAKKNSFPPRTKDPSLRDDGSQFLKYHQYLHSNIDKVHTNIEKIDGNQHSEIDECKEYEDPEPNGVDQVRDNFIDDPTGNRESDSG